MLKLVIVDDEKMPRDILTNYIQWTNLGIEVVGEADDGINAFNLILELKPDIVISDIKMPKMNGIELATQVKDHLPECKFIFLSGYSDKEYLKSAIKLKAINYVEKPINLEEITDVIKETVHLCIKEKEKDQKVIKLTEQKLCLDLIKPKLDIRTIQKQIDDVKKSFTNSNHYITAVIKLNAKGLPDIKEMIVKLLKACLKPISSDYLLAFKEEDICVLHFKIQSYGSITRTLGCFIDEVKQSLGEQSKLFIGLGQEVDTLYDLHYSYQTAVISIQKHFFRGYNEIIQYEQDDSTAYTFDENILLLIETAIKSEKKTETELLIKRLVYDMRKYENTNHDDIRNIFYKIILVVSRFAEDRNISLFENQRRYILQTISSTNTLKEIEQGVLQLIDIIFNKLDANKDSQDILSKITHYIYENFTNQNLSINSIAENLNLTPTYLCMVFKRDTGKTINQYITNVRMEKAKEYLKFQDKKLYAIAKMVGYNDGKYFTKVFTKFVGMNPKKYREIHCHDEENI